MAVSDGQLANAANFNSAYLSKTQDSNTVGKVGLLNTDAESGDTIANAQSAINKLTFKTYGEQSISASGTVTVSNYKGLQYRRVSGSGGAITLAAQPFGTTSSTPDGTIVRLMGMNDTNTVTIANSDTQYGAILNGGCTLKRYESIDLQWDSALERWIEIRRSN